MTGTALLAAGVAKVAVLSEISIGRLAPSRFHLNTATINIALAAALLGSAILAPAAMAQDTSSNHGKFSASGSGIVVPARSWDISAEVPNQIKKIYFKEGQFVKKGDLLVEFDTMFKKLDAELAELALARAKTDLARANEQLQRKKKLGLTARCCHIK